MVDSLRAINNDTTAVVKVFVFLVKERYITDLGSSYYF